MEPLVIMDNTKSGLIFVKKDLSAFKVINIADYRIRYIYMLTDIWFTVEL
jgi:hypothetical protein